MLIPKTIIHNTSKWCVYCYELLFHFVVLAKQVYDSKCSSVRNGMLIENMELLAAIQERWLYLLLLIFNTKLHSVYKLIVYWSVVY